MLEHSLIRHLRRLFAFFTFFLFEIAKGKSSLLLVRNFSNTATASFSDALPCLISVAISILAIPQRLPLLTISTTKT